MHPAPLTDRLLILAVAGVVLGVAWLWNLRDFLRNPRQPPTSRWYTETVEPQSEQGDPDRAK